MNFLTRFLKVYLVALVLSALGAFVFYKVVIEGSKLRSDVSYEQFLQTVYMGAGVWFGFITLLSVLLAVAGMKKTIAVPVYDRNIFLHRLNSAVTSLRYRPHHQSENLIVFKPPVVPILAEKISVQLNQNSATITAPRGLLRKIQERL